ncbi:hypothetical protein C2G38_2140865 [Gigaspora rosea]|uniref:Uncharacterized protein n=1 Tax=Gigaspora rosea TaxID=44941 RepID=A0A397VI68_9GLOM|nr:hypothetical protein C2G38_2140865 [Gigaspora rosea]
MKLSSYHYKLISQCLFLTILLITSSESQTITPDYINYTESTAGTSLPSNPPQVVTVHTYDDGSILVSIAREIYSTQKTNSTQEYNCIGQSIEPILRLRIIQLDGTIKEINPHLSLDLMNFCILNDSHGNPVNPISIYPIYEKFILINYVNVSHLNGLTTYEDWGSVIDWSGNSLSDIRYGPSYTNGTLNWKPLSITQLNVNKKQGFFRLQIVNQNWIECQQYLVDNSGILSKLISHNVTIIDPNAFNTNAFSMITTIPLVTGDYAILSVNSSSTNSLSIPGGLYMTTIFYNKSDISNQVLLYQITLPSVSFLGLYCDLAPNKIGYMCIIETTYNNSQRTYMKIQFLTSESVTSIDLLSKLTNTSSIGVMSQGFGMQAMAFGGYIFYFMAKNQSYYIWTYDENNINTKDLELSHANKYAANPIFYNFNQNNLNAANSIMKNNNTFILALNTTNSSSQWSLIKVPLPPVIEDYHYGNLHVVKIDPPPNNMTGVYSNVDSKTNTINITFRNPIILSTGFITIYKSSDNTIRQKVQATMSDYVTINDDHTIVKIKIIGSTFNEKGVDYYVQMDANFVRDEKLYEPLTGIDERIVNYKSSNNPPSSEEAFIYFSRLIPDATNRFKLLTDSKKAEYFNDLLQDMANKLPIRPALLAIKDGYQYIFNSLQFAIRVNKTNSNLDNNTVPGIVSDINIMIQNKKITTFGDGITNDLDDTFGFKERKDIFGDYKDQIVPFLSIAAVNTFLYLSTRSKKTVPDSLVQIINTASAGLFSASHTTFSSIFSFSDVNNYAAFSITSKILWIVPLTINIIVFTYIMYKRGLSEMTIMNLITIALTFYNSETFLLVNKAQIDSLFGKEFESTAKWRAIADVLLKSIPQLIIQIIYFNIIVTYSVIPFFTLCATAFMIFLSAIQAILSVITNGVDNKKKDEETNNEKKDVKKDEDEGDKKGDNNQEKK